MPKVVDNACADKGTPLMIKGNTPRVACSLTKQIKFLGDWVDAKQSAREVENTILLLHDRSIENAIKTV